MKGDSNQPGGVQVNPVPDAAGLSAADVREKINAFLSKRGIRYIVLVQEENTLPYVELLYIKYRNGLPVLAHDTGGRIDIDDAVSELTFLEKNPAMITSIARAKIAEMPYMDETGIGGKLRPALYIKYRGMREIKPLYEITK